MEVASRALRDLRWHKTNDAHWCGLLRARWPREGPVLCSLPAAGDRAPALPSVRHEAGFNANHAATERVVDRDETDDEDVEEIFRIEGEDQANDDPDRLVFSCASVGSPVSPSWMLLHCVEAWTCLEADGRRNVF